MYGQLSIEPGLLLLCLSSLHIGLHAACQTDRDKFGNIYPLQVEHEDCARSDRGQALLVEDMLQLTTDELQDVNDLNWELSEDLRTAHQANTALTCESLPCGACCHISCAVPVPVSSTKPAGAQRDL